jgi:hypothetical protein
MSVGSRWRHLTGLSHRSPLEAACDEKFYFPSDIDKEKTGSVGATFAEKRSCRSL